MTRSSSTGLFTPACKRRRLKREVKKGVYLRIKHNQLGLDGLSALARTNIHAHARGKCAARGDTEHRKGRGVDSERLRLISEEPLP